MGRHHVSVATPRRLDEALAFRRDNPSALVITGGTDLMVEVNFNRRKPEDVLSLARVDELHRVDTSSPSVVRIGAAVPWARMERGDLARLLPALAEAARTVGSPQIRQAGTLGGNLGTCSPAGDGLPVLGALDASIVLRSTSTERIVPFSDFMVGPKRNVLQPDELITAVEIPLTSSWQGYSKVGVRNAMVISVASACAALSKDGSHFSIALGAVGPTIIRCTATEQWLTDLGKPAIETLSSPTTRHELGERAAAEARPITDHRSTADYRRHAISVIVRRLAERAINE